MNEQVVRQYRKLVSASFADQISRDLREDSRLRFVSAFPVTIAKIGGPDYELLATFEIIEPV